MARPTLLTAHLRDELLRAIRLGAPIHVACEHAGIAERTYYAWVERGKAAQAAQDAHDAWVDQQAGEDPMEGPPPPEPSPRELPYLQFVQVLPQAMATSEVVLLGRLHQHARDRWNPAAWLLERRHPERYARVQRTELVGDAHAPLQVESRSVEVQVRTTPAELATTDVERARQVLAAIVDTGLLDAAALPPAQPEDGEDVA